jgi:hypothetical protein
LKRNKRNYKAKHNARIFRSSWTPPAGRRGTADRQVLPRPGLCLLHSARKANSAAVSSDTFDKITRYTLFASASYDDNCATPPFGSRIVKTFRHGPTDTQATLFRDDGKNELIIAFRGTSTPKDLDSDLAFRLVPLSATGTNCRDCKVRKHFLRFTSERSSNHLNRSTKDSSLLTTQSRGQFHRQSRLSCHLALDLLSRDTPSAAALVP